MDFKGFPKIARLHRDIIITEKLDGTNACVAIAPLSEAPFQSEPLAIAADGEGAVDSVAIWAQSRKRHLSLDSDNYGFAHWVYEHKHELALLGPGYHYGEWWGQGIQRNYDLDEKRFSLFRWYNELPECCHEAPILWQGVFDHERILDELALLETNGSTAAPGFRPAEGIVVYHTHARRGFKVTLENDAVPKSQVRA